MEMYTQTRWPSLRGTLSCSVLRLLVPPIDLFSILLFQKPPKNQQWKCGCLRTSLAFRYARLALIKIGVSGTGVYLSFIFSYWVLYFF